MSGWRDRYDVHPAAAVFPMLSDEELDALAKDINAHGLREPVTLLHSPGTPLVLDGRNRLAAMERAGIPVEPSMCEMVDTDDPAAYIIRQEHPSAAPNQAAAGRADRACHRGNAAE